jgi:methylated-DNA-[protein]-cysteine S-methyltransferase
MRFLRNCFSCSNIFHKESINFNSSKRFELRTFPTSNLVVLHPMKHLQTAYLNSPLGLICITATADGISSIHLGGELCKDEFMHNEHLAIAKTQLQEYLNGQRKQFDLKYDLAGTDFQLRVWHELEKIPFGKTISYLELANKLGDKKVIRAAASANGRNPIAIAIPCHRVIGANGKLVGYAGGLWRKQWLLEHEGGSVNYKLDF